MEDRLADLKGGVRIPVTAETAPDELMPAFNKKINAIQYYLNKVKENNVKIKQLKEKHLSTTLIEKENEISEELDNIISENAKNCNIIKGELEYMEAEVAKAKETEKDEPETRIRDITYRALKGKFAEVLKEAQKIQIDYKTTVKAKITRQVKAMDPSLTPDQIEEIYNDPNGTTKLLQNKMLGQGHLKLRNAVADIQDKYKDIRKLEKSVEAIHQMFVDMQLLVHAQGEMLDTIEINVQGANDYVTKANVQLSKAKKSHITYKKYRCCLLILVLIIIAVVIIVPIATKV